MLGAVSKPRAHQPGSWLLPGLAYYTRSALQLAGGKGRRGSARALSNAEPRQVVNKGAAACASQGAVGPPRSWRRVHITCRSHAGRL